MERLDVWFSSGAEHCHAWLYLPAGEKPAPVIVMAHGLGAVKSMRLDAYAERFCAAGYACLVFDYRHFGESEGKPRQLLDIGRQLQDWQAAVDHVHQRDDVDGKRVVLWGSSFSGGHVLSIGAANHDIAAVISQCPFTHGLASSLAIPLLTSIRLMARALLDTLRAMAGRPPIMVNTAGHPGETALMTAPDAMPGYLSLLPEDGATTFHNEVAARFALQIIRYFPGRKAAEIKCPVLFCVCENDSVAPAGPTMRYARRAPQGEIKTYPEGHFEIYVGDAFEKVMADQLAFLKKQIPVS